METDQEDKIIQSNLIDRLNELLHSNDLEVLHRASLAISNMMGIESYHEDFEKCGGVAALLHLAKSNNVPLETRVRALRGISQLSCGKEDLVSKVCSGSINDLVSIMRNKDKEIKKTAIHAARNMSCYGNAVKIY